MAESKDFDGSIVNPIISSIIRKHRPTCTHAVESLQSEKLGDDCESQTGSQ